MPRRHLFEFMDHPWLPRTLRDAMAAYLETCYRVLPLPPQFSERIATALRATGERRVLDLCSGAGGPAMLLMPKIRERLGEAVELRMTDLYPNQAAIARVASLHDPQVSYDPAPVDALELAGDPPGVRTMFAGLHHLRPPQARAVLENAFLHRRAICVFEVSEHSWRGILAALPIPLMTLLLTPLVRPVRVSQLLLTYLLPVLPPLIFWDGLVSQLRTYTPDELRALTADLTSPDYAWDIGEIALAGAPLRLPYLVGCPR